MLRVRMIAAAISAAASALTAGMPPAHASDIYPQRIGPWIIVEDWSGRALKADDEVGNGAQGVETYWLDPLAVPQQWDYAMTWNLTQNNDGTYVIQNLPYKQCLTDLQPDKPFFNGLNPDANRVGLRSCTHDATQNFNINVVPGTNDTFTITSVDHPDYGLANQQNWEDCCTTLARMWAPGAEAFRWRLAIPPQALAPARK